MKNSIKQLIQTWIVYVSEFFCSILENLRELAEGCLGRPMLYELIEVHLIEGNKNWLGKSGSLRNQGKITVFNWENDF